MVHDTPPVYVSNTRQLQGFVSLEKNEKLRLCVEITENKDDEMNRNDRTRETSKTFFNFSSEAEVSDVESRDENYSGSYDEQSTIVCFYITAGLCILMFSYYSWVMVFLCFCDTAEFCGLMFCVMAEWMSYGLISRSKNKTSQTETSR